MATAPAPTKVHVEVAGFQAFGEFHGYNNDCGPDAELMARHPFDGSLLDPGVLNTWWKYDYLATGHGDQYGATLAGIYWHLTQSAHKLDPTKATVASYVKTDSTSLASTHALLIQALARGQTAIGYLQNAQALAYNERHVYGHFIAFGGLDSDQGYLVGNGDDVNALGGHGIIATRWYGWASIAAAQLNGFIALAKAAPIIPNRPPTPPSTGTIPAGWHDTQGGNPANFAGILSAANGIPVVRGMRSYVLTHTWAQDNYPVAAEYLTPQIELANPASGKGSRQDFRYGSLGCQQHSDGSWGSPYPIMVGNEIALLGQTSMTLHARLAQIAQLAKE